LINISNSAVGGFIQGINICKSTGFYTECSFEHFKW